MQNRYVGDIGDFYKYGLLQNLCGNELRLGVNWYLNTLEEANSDGEITEYTYLRNTDEALFSALMDIIRNGRSVIEIERKAGFVLPAGTQFYTKPIPASPHHYERDNWFEGSLEQLKNCKVIFCDPDNGLEIATCSKYHKTKAVKYIFLDEIKDIYRNVKASLVIYQHTGRTGSHENQIIDRKKQLSKVLGIEPDLTTVVKCGGRYFLIIMQPTHTITLRKNLASLESSKWRNMLQIVKQGQTENLSRNRQNIIKPLI